jgi:hypothetical protein
MQTSRILMLSLMLGVGGCVGLQQYPKVSTSAETDLTTRDADYLQVLARIAEAGSPEKQKQLRNEAIDKRLRVIDLNFQDFETALAKENVRADFGIAAVQVGLGAAGALVSETASQILSAVSGGLAGTQAAYGRAALFNQAFPALLAQMIASRNAVLVLIYEGKTRTLEEYPLATAIRDLDAYYFAGSLPGAVVATSADATAKNAAAEDRLAKFRVAVFGEDDSAKKIRAFIRPPDGKQSDPVNAANLKKVEDWIEQSPVVKDLPIANFLSDPRLKDLRERAIRDIPIP